VAVALCFQGSPEIKVVQKSDIDLPGPADTAGTPVALPKYEPEKKQVVSDAQKPGGRKGKEVKKYLPPQVITFNGAKIPPGTMGTARLATGASNGPVRAELLEPMTFNGQTYVEAGTVLIGSGSSTEERLFIRFNQMVFRDGSVKTIQAQAYDSEDKIPGLKGSKVGNFALNLAGSIGLNFSGGLSDGLQEQEVTGGVAVRKNTVKNAFLNGASVAALDQSKELMSSLKNKQPIIEVPAGTSIVVVVGADGQ
jgi:hypothetical protein